MTRRSAPRRAGILAPLLAAGALAGLAACQSPGGKYDEMLHDRGLAGISRETLTVCHGHGCRLRTRVDLTAQDWAPLAALFATPAADAAAERDRIAAAIGLLEDAAGRHAGTVTDVGGTLNGFGMDPGGATGFDDQFDCVDETTNTTVYLTLLAQAGYLTWHRIDGWAGRGSLIGPGDWPHQTAVIVERLGGRAWAVDSWFEDNGHAAYVVPLQEWYAGWVPPGFIDSPF